MDFLEEVMRGKGFPETWINIIMDTVTGGKVCINVNGSRSPFSKSSKAKDMLNIVNAFHLSPLCFST